MLKRFFGKDAVRFRACSLTLPEGSRCGDPAAIFRSYASFSEAANENAVSRILIGIHFRDAVEQGVRHGRRIGRRAFKLYLRPLR